MKDVYQRQPDFTKYKLDNSGTDMRVSFWEDEYFGGPINQPIHREGYANIENNMSEKLSEDWNDRSWNQGLFILYGLETSNKVFVDVWIYNNNLL